jgi:tetratricopeptide (TPR) repeat protein
MVPRRCSWLVALCILGATLGGVGYAWGHRRAQELMRPDRAYHAKTQASHQPSGLQSAEKLSGAASRLSKPELPAGQRPRAFPAQDNLLKSINLYPDGPERSAAFFRLARQAETYGHVDLAIKVYTLAAALHPDTLDADRARLRRFTLELYLDLGGSDPFEAFRNFLAKLSGLSTSFPPQELQDPLTAGWTALAQLNGSSFLAGRALILWEMHPPGTHPPAGALVVGRLLQDQGLFEEAGRLFFSAWDKGTGQVRTQALVELLQLAWGSQGLPGFVDALQYWRRQPEDLLPALKTWPLQLDAQDGVAPTLRPDGLGDFGDLKELLRGADCSSASPDMPTAADVGVWEALLSQPLPASLQEYLVRAAAQRYWSQGDFTGAGNLYRRMLARAPAKENSLFYWDRLGVAHLRERQPDLASDIFQALKREPGRFWQLLADARRLDLELDRLMAE